MSAPSGGDSRTADKPVGLFGGTFDPLTIAHLLAARWALEQLDLLEVRFIPNLRNPLKGDVAAPPEIRLEMLLSALASLDDFRVETLELERGGPSYTIDTVRTLVRREPAQRFILLAGADILAGFHRWRNPEEILELVELAVFRRGEHLPVVENLEWKKSILTVDIPHLDISSTLVRQRVREGKSIRFLVPPEVEEIIQRESLYIRNERQSLP